MKTSSLIAWAFVAALAIPAHAETVRVPESGDPAFTAELPDGWTHETRSDGSLKAFSAAHTAAITLKVMRYIGTPEEVAAGALTSADGMPPTTTGAVEISGYQGAGFDGAVVNSDGVKAKVHLVVLRIDDRHLAVATMMTADNLDAAQTEAAAAVFKTVTLTKIAPPAPPPPAPTVTAPPAPATPATPETTATPPTPPAPETPPPAKP